ncbi:MAG: phosphoesterase [Candidatus Aenigmatarchaeota archaeon]|nr:MAG: phosphoesterase [Candidatus Aenigmarchaeota archaeon]
MILDIALHDEDAPLILAELKRISSKYELLYIDHHPLPNGTRDRDVPDEYVHDTNRSTAELAYMYLHEKLPREFSRIALYGAIGDYADDTNWITKELEKWDKRIIYFQAGILLEAMGEARHLYDLKRRIVRELVKGVEPSEMKDVVELALKEARHDKLLYERLVQNHTVVGKVAYAIIEMGSLAKGAHLIMGIADAKVGVIGILEGGHVDMSLRANKGFAHDLARVARKVAKPLGGSAGGHAAACGAQVPAKNFERFIKELARELGGK